MSSRQKVTEEIVQKYYKAFDGGISQSRPVLSSVGNIQNMITPQPEYVRIKSVAVRLKEHADKGITTGLGYTCLI
jgi:hypothetical protein